MRAHADVDAVTVDALGTLVRLRDPVPALRAALARHGVEQDAANVSRAFAAEVAHYKPRCVRGRDVESLRALREECVAVFLRAAGADLDAAAFAADFVAAIAFEPEPGAEDALASLAAASLPVAVVSNWDISLSDTLEQLGLARHVAAVVTSAEVGTSKPDPAIFRIALGRLGSAAPRTLHVGDEDADAQGAARAGLLFRPAPLAPVVAELAA
jgi:putative hydrolase of the HAD superfamily